MNQLKVLKGETVTTKNGREFTKILGGFDDNKPIITDKQIGELLEYSKGARDVRDRLNRKDNYGKENIKYFEEGIHIQDLQRVAEKDTLTETLISLGYAKQSIKQASHIYIFSQAGFLLFLKFAEGDKAIELYKDFIEDYFKLQAENIVMKKTLEEELEYLKELRASALGKMFMESDSTKKIELFNENEKLNKRMTEIEKSMKEEEVIKKLKDDLDVAKVFTDNKGYFDIGTFSKIIKVKDLGRNNLFAWMRYKEILMSNNQPYQRYIDYFKVLPIENKYTHRIDYKTMIRANGVKYIIKKLVDDGKVVTKSIDEIVSELEQINDNKKAS